MAVYRNAGGNLTWTVKFFLCIIGEGIIMLTCGFINVMDFGAKGDGVTDDTAAIQKAINHASERGGGKIFFPYTPNGYRIASPAREFVDGKPCRGQLYIPAKSTANICLEGEMPCRMLYSYQVRPADCAKIFKPTRFGTMSKSNTMLFSDWQPPEERLATARPWALLATIEGTSCLGKFSTGQVSIVNLEFRVKLDKENMYPTGSAVNLQNASRVLIQDSQFCLDDTIGDTELGKELQPNPCHTVGLMTSGDQNDNNVLRNVSVQGFRYGFVLGEHVQAEYLYVHNCEEAIVFHDCSHLSLIMQVVAQHNQRLLTTTREELFGHRKGPCFVKILGVDLEGGAGLKPAVSEMKYGIFDPENRLHGSLAYHFPWGPDLFNIEGGKFMRVEKFGSGEVR